MIRIVLADDHSIVRSGLAQLLAAGGDGEVVGEAGTADETLRALERHAPDLLLLDMNMPGSGGVALIERLRELQPRVPVLVLSMLDDAQIMRRALRAGAAGYVTKDAGIAVLRQAISRVLAGGRFVDPQLAVELAVQGDQAPPARHDSLSAREREVLAMIVAGLRLGEIADRLHVSAKTISTHKMRLMDKLGVQSNADLVRYAIEHGLTASRPHAGR